MSVLAWLQQQGLEQYAQAFADNDVDMTALCLLKEADLEKLGVSLGHRKRLMRAIAELGDVPAAALPPRAELKAAAGESGERRPLTAVAGQSESCTRLESRNHFVPVSRNS